MRKPVTPTSVEETVQVRNVSGTDKLKYRDTSQKPESFT